MSMSLFQCKEVKGMFLIIITLQLLTIFSLQCKRSLWQGILRLWLLEDAVLHHIPWQSGVRKAAWPSAVNTDCSAKPMRSLPPSDRMRYRASESRHATNIPLIFSIFLAITFRNARCIFTDGKGIFQHNPVTKAIFWCNHLLLLQNIFPTILIITVFPRLLKEVASNKLELQ